MQTRKDLTEEQGEFIVGWEQAGREFNDTGNWTIARYVVQYRLPQPRTVSSQRSIWMRDEWLRPIEALPLCQPGGKAQ